MRGFAGKYGAVCVGLALLDGSRLLAGCGGLTERDRYDAGPVGSGGTGADDAGATGSGDAAKGDVPLEWTACELDWDCAWVSYNDCCVVGAIAVNNDFFEEGQAWVARRHSMDPCACPIPEPTFKAGCEEGACVAKVSCEFMDDPGWRGRYSVDPGGCESRNDCELLDATRCNGLGEPIDNPICVDVTQPCALQVNCLRDRRDGNRVELHSGLICASVRYQECGPDGPSCR